MVFSDAARHGRSLPSAVVLGTDEIASAVAVDLLRDGWSVVLAHDPHAPVLRRGMAFHDALWGETVAVDGVAAVVIDRVTDLLFTEPRPDRVAVTRLGLVDLMTLGRLALLVDARPAAAAAVPDLRHLAEATIGLGPGFVAGRNCDEAVDVGADEVSSHLVRAPEAGPWRTALPLGGRVFRGMVAGRLGRLPVTVPVDGVLRGLVRDGTDVARGVDLIEIDRRNRWQARWTGIDARGRAVAEAVATAARTLRAARTPSIALIDAVPMPPRPAD